MVIADHSASIRVAPLLIFFKHLDFNLLNTWVGYGYGYTKTIMVGLIPGIDEELWAGSAFLPSYILDNGIISALVFFLFVKRNLLVSVISFEALFLILILINSSFNSQLFWFSIIIFTINKILIKKQKLYYHKIHHQLNTDVIIK